MSFVLMVVSITTISTIIQSMTVADSGGSIGGSIGGGGSVSSVTQSVSVTDSWSGITNLSYGGGGVCGSIGGGGSVSSVTQAVSVAQSRGSITNLGYGGGGHNSRGSITDFSYGGGGDNSGGSITKLSYGGGGYNAGGSISAVVSSRIADLRHVGQRGGGVAKCLSVSKTCDSTLFGFLLCFFSEDADSHSQHDASLLERKHDEGVTSECPRKMD
jgi:hypothetical protein